MEWKAPDYYPLDEEFGYSVPHHRWLLNGTPLKDEEADPIYRQKMAERREQQSKQAVKPGAKSAQYCRSCNPDHNADGICGQHAFWFDKLLHTLNKRILCIEDKEVAR